MKKLIFVVLLYAMAMALNASLVSAAESEPYGLEAMRQFDRLPYLKLDTMGGQVSSYDRNGGFEEGNNDGFGSSNYLYIDSVTNEKVMLDLRGPGTVYRMWFTGFDENTANINIYLRNDNGTYSKQTYLMKDIFFNKVSPFLNPLVKNKNESIGGFISYLPITFKSGIKLTTNGDGGSFFYNIGYHVYSPDTVIPNWTKLEDSTTVRNMWNNVGLDPKTHTDNTTVSGSKNLLAAGATTTLLNNLAGPRSISSIKLKIDGITATTDNSATVKDILNNTWLKIYYDGSTTASVDAPLGALFAMGNFGSYATKALPVGIDSTNNMYIYFPMPFQSNVTVKLYNGRTVATNNITYEIKHRPYNVDFTKTGYFKTKYSIENHTVTYPASDNNDFLILDTSGTGQFVGVVQSVEAAINQHPNLDRSHHEGDERIYVDDSNTPIYHGTGTEDFYNSGWYYARGPFMTSELFTTPLSGYTSYNFNAGGIDQSSMYRFMLQDAVPFKKNIRVSIQHGTDNNVSAKGWLLAFYYHNPTNRAELTDLLNIGNSTSESSHGYTITNQTFTGSRDFVFEGEFDFRTITDDGRAHTGESKFTMKINPVNEGVLLRRQFDKVIANQAADVYVKNAIGVFEKAGTWYTAGSNPHQRWRDEEFMIPASYTNGKSSIEIKIVYLSGYSVDWNEFKYYAYSLGAIPAVVPAQSTFFATAMVDEGDAYNTASDGDLWPSAWSNDDYLYLANGDGKGWDLNAAWNDIVFNRITSGHPDSGNLVGNKVSANMSQVWNTTLCGDGSPKYNRKPTGLTSRGGTLWMAVQDLNKCPGTKFYSPMFNDAPNATILKSTNKGVTWTWNTSVPMFPNHIFTTIFFLDWGKDGVDNDPNTTWDNYIYAYALDYNWRDSFSNTTPDPTKLYLARILAADNVQDIAKWQFWTGGLSGGAESWSALGDIGAKKPILQDDTRVYKTVTSNFPTGDIRDMTVLSQGSVTYNRALNRYIYLSWSEYTFEFYEAPAPWGPWKKFVSKDIGAYNSPWTDTKNAGYTTVMPSKYISADGKKMWFNANSFEGPINNYRFSLRPLWVTVHNPSLTPSNARSSTDNLAVSGEAKTPITKASFHQGNPWALNDGSTNVNTDDWNGEAKPLSYWGYAWSRPYHMNKVVYTTGNMFADGGWFSSGLKVQVRQNFNWVDVAGASVSPDYPYNSNAGAYQTYTFKFDDTWGDGVRIIGDTGGTQHFTSISELAVYYSPVTIITDHFDGPLASAWTWSVPLAGPTYSFTNSNFRLNLPDTNAYDNWTTVDNSPKITRTDMGSGDWSIETKLNLVNYAVNTNFHTGLIVKFGANNYFTWGHLKGNTLEFSRSGYPALGMVENYTSPSVYLRLRKAGSRYYYDYKANAGDSWNNVSSDHYPWDAPIAVGLMTKTWSNLNHTTDFDYFTITK